VGCSAASELALAWGRVSSKFFWITATGTATALTETVGFAYIQRPRDRRSTQSLEVADELHHASSFQLKLPAAQPAVPFPSSQREAGANKPGTKP
jgi:hypothetical protein